MLAANDKPRLIIIIKITSRVYRRNGHKAACACGAEVEDTEITLIAHIADSGWADSRSKGAAVRACWRARIAGPFTAPAIFIATILMSAHCLYRQKCQHRAHRQQFAAAIQ